MSSRTIVRVRVLLLVELTAELIFLLHLTRPRAIANPAQFATTQVDSIAQTLATKASQASCSPPLCLDWSSYETENTYGIAWGDVDGDGDLDLAIGNQCFSVPNCRSTRLYRNDKGALTPSPVWSSIEADSTTSVAWGDYDRDGDLDLAVGNYDQSNRLYRNDGGTLTSSAVWSSTEADSTYSVAWGDVDGDGDLDLVVGNYSGQPNRLYRNDGGTLMSSAVWSSTESDFTSSIAWGDVDGDGDLDLAVGNWGDPNRVYRNNGGTLTPSAVWSSSESDLATSVAWGDVDGDGDLDLAVGTAEANRLYRNNGGMLTSSAVWSSAETDYTNSVMWGDDDGDGDPDLAVGNIRQPNRLYRNDGGTLTASAIWSSAEVDDTTSIAWGDYDGDGDLDLAVGNGSQPNRLYRNEAGTLGVNPVWSTAMVDSNTDVAWGDVDGDGDLDLAVTGEWIHLNVNGDLQATLAWAPVDGLGSIAWGDYDNDGDLDVAGGNRLYRNDGGTLTDHTVWSPGEAGTPTSTAWGDYDVDGDLDLVVGYGDFGQPTGQLNRLYRNDGGTLTTNAVWSSVEADYTTSVAWGDYDGDGDLDLAVGNGQSNYWGIGQPSRLYRNNGGTLTASAVWSAAEVDNTTSIAWGDYDGDGDLDLITGNSGHPNRLYRNDNGVLAASAVWSSIESDVTTSVAWGDYDGDGDIDLAVGVGSGGGAQSRLYRNDMGMLTARAVWSSVGSEDVRSVAWGDYDGDGDLDLVSGNNASPSRLYRNNRDNRLVPGSVPVVHLVRPARDANFYSTPRVWSGIIPITYTLSDPQGDPVRFVRAWYSPDGGGRWLPAVASTGTITANLATTATYTYNWDTLASGFFGQSDNVVFRLQAVPSITNTRNSIPGPYVYGAYASQTFPFRVRGTQVRVLSGTQSISNALVFRLPKGQSMDARAMSDSAGNPFHTDGQGYLQGRGQLNIGDHLVALYPITATDAYTLNGTSAAPALTGLNMHTVTQAGVQTLTVSAANPLILFNLDVSLEWDVRQDANTLNRLKYDLQRASELLFDWTDGQAALGHINLYQAGEHWNDANVRILANNRLRPNASQGGIVSSTLSEIITTSIASTQIITYEPGQIRMAVNWNRYGDPDGTIGDDWARAFAHELGHYLFFQDDDYLGYDTAGNFVAVPDCPSAMSDPYSGDKGSGYDEFHPRANWASQCANTLANRETGRSDWQTLKRFYPALNETSATTPGPGSLPLAVTQIDVKPITSTSLITPLLAPLYSLVRAEGGSFVPQRANGYLFQDTDQNGLNNRLIELGNPVSGKIEARGARAGDRLCVIDPEAKRLGCAVMNDVNRTLALTARPDWAPSILVTPVSSRTIQVSVSGVAQTVSMQAQLFPQDGDASAVIVLNKVGMTNTYVGTFTLPTEALEASVHIWIDETGARRETLTSYSIGGDPVPRRPGTGSRHYPPRRYRRAPVLSSDGQAQVLGIQSAFPPGEFYALQTVDNFPAPPVWTTVIGQAYRLVKSAGAPSLTGATFVVNYLESEVPAGEEPFLALYFYPLDGSGWRRLPTSSEPDADLVFAPAQVSDGLYLLLSSIDMSLTPGWNNVPYPVRGSRPVTEALASIAGQYSHICGYITADVLNPWHCFGSNAPHWVNDLTALEFGSYWINLTTTQPVTLSLKGPFGADLQQPDQSTGLQLPPAVYYGRVAEGSADTILSATIEDQVCGRTTTELIDGLPRYVIDVSASDLDGASVCGESGRSVTFHLDDQPLVPSALWSNAAIWELDLSPAQHMCQIFLPLIRR